MAEKLNVSKPAITRALDRLTSLKLIRRKKDDSDRRNVLIQRTVRGSVFLREYGDVVVSSAEALGIGGEISSRDAPHIKPATPEANPVTDKAPSAAQSDKQGGDDDETWFTNKLKNEDS